MLISYCCIFPPVPPGPAEKAPFGLDEEVKETNLTSIAENRAAFLSNVLYWPNGRVPYEFAPDVPGKNDQGCNLILFFPVWLLGSTRANFVRATEILAMHSPCVRVVPRQSSDDDYVLIRNGDGCSSGIGKKRTGGEQIITLAPGCSVSL